MVVNLLTLQIYFKKLLSMNFLICSQDQLYVQNVELARFCAQFRDISNKFAENEKTIRSLQVMGSNLYEVSWLVLVLVN